MSRHQIVTTPMVTGEFTGIRIGPRIYTAPDEVDLVADRVMGAMRDGVARGRRAPCRAPAGASSRAAWGRAAVG